jgi:hypothetical protein
MNNTRFAPPIITALLSHQEVERFIVDGTVLTVWEDEVMDILDQRWLLVVCEHNGQREVTSWTFLERNA